MVTRSLPVQQIHQYQQISDVQAAGGWIKAGVHMLWLSTKKIHNFVATMETIKHETHITQNIITHDDSKCTWSV